MRQTDLSLLVRPERFELPTPKFVAWCSIQLSYGRASRQLCPNSDDSVNVWVVWNLAESEGS